ncbi:MAG: Uxx-star family glutaredoxin-like (seleno)protein [Candidatus Baltobacteraceae bacterium]
MSLELYATRSCPYCAELRDELEDAGRAFVEYDVEADLGARARLSELTKGSALVPVLVEDGRVVQVGMQGRGCYIGLA